jgi:hypothetical protein
MEGEKAAKTKKEAKTEVLASRGVEWYWQKPSTALSLPCQAGLLLHSRDARRSVVRDLPPEGMSCDF